MPRTLFLIFLVRQKTSNIIMHALLLYGPFMLTSAANYTESYSLTQITNHQEHPCLDLDSNLAPVDQKSENYTTGHGWAIIMHHRVQLTVEKLSSIIFSKEEIWYILGNNNIFPFSLRVYPVFCFIHNEREMGSLSNGQCIAFLLSQALFLLLLRLG